MAPTTSFLQITPHVTIPTRTFVNLPQVEKNILDTWVADDDGELQLKLQRVERITLSNRDLRNLYSELHERIVKVLCEFSEAELQSLNKFQPGEYAAEINSATDRESHMLKIPLKTDHWQGFLVISMEGITAIRAVLSGKDPGELKKVRHSLTYGNLMMRSLTDERVNLEEEGDDQLEPEEDLKSFHAKYTRRRIVPIPLNVYIHSRTVDIEREVID